MRLFCFGLGYSASAVARALTASGFEVAGTTRDGRAIGPSPTLAFDGRRSEAVARALAGSTHVLVSVPPAVDGRDGVLEAYGPDLAVLAGLRWIGYLSTVGVYGDRRGDWVDETSEPRPSSARSRARVRAEQAWLDLGQRSGKRVEVFRLSGIYGPGRSALDQLRAGTARRIIKSGQVFNRIHVDDIAQAVMAAMMRPESPHAIYNVTDDEPAPPQDVVAYAARLLGVSPPPEVPFEAAGLSPMGASFYAECKRVSNARLKQALGLELLYPTYREGLAALLARERRSG